MGSIRIVPEVRKVLSIRIEKEGEKYAQNENKIRVLQQFNKFFYVRYLLVYSMTVKILESSVVDPDWIRIQESKNVTPKKRKG